MLKFIDLFAGLGGFHLALSQLGHSCVFASEKKEDLAKLYERNFGIIPNRDITKIDVTSIPQHDILCAGFPCQPFSKAGDQKGLDDERNGNLFNIILDILDFHRPEYMILENVKNLENHNKKQTWNYIETKLAHLGYSVKKDVLSPHNYGIPQHRERVFIVGAKSGLDYFRFPKPFNDTNHSINNYLDISQNEKRELEKEKVEVLNIWQEFLDAFPKTEKLPSFPIWAMEFGATYPFEDSTPFSTRKIELEKYKGSFGESLNGYTSKKKLFQNLPSYARSKEKKFPTWKKHFIRSNREFYKKYRPYLLDVVEKIKKLEFASFQKFEWNCQGEERLIKNLLIQFRGSGVRVKKVDYFPSLVCVSTQIPIIGWENRYISPTEGARIQCLNGIELPENIGTCFSALGNAVNVELVKLITLNLINERSPNNLNTPKLTLIQNE